MTSGPFTRHFDAFVCEGDSITCMADGFTLTARLEADDSGEAPDKWSDGFWPSLDPASPGFIGAKSPRTLRRHMAKAREVMAAFEAGDLWQCGVVVAVWRNGIELDAYAASLWGIEANWPHADGNPYLLDVANQLADEALDAGRAIVAALCECTAEAA